MGMLHSNETMAQTYPTSDQFLSVATINQDRLFSESQFGKSFNQKFQNDATLLTEENRRIENELAIEESDLTQKRKELQNMAGSAIGIRPSRDGTRTSPAGPGLRCGFPRSVDRASWSATRAPRADYGA